MIITTQKNLSRYRAMSPLMERAIEYIESVNMDTLQPGREPVMGDNIYMMVQNYLTRDFSAGLFETHDNYIDIQCLIEGEELIYCADREEMEPSGPYNAENDKTNYHDKDGADSIHMKPGTIVIFYPEDGHKACIKAGDALTPVRKLLLKVRVAAPRHPADAEESPSR